MMGSIDPDVGATPKNEIFGGLKPLTFFYMMPKHNSFRWPPDFAF